MSFSAPSWSCNTWQLSTNHLLILSQNKFLKHLLSLKVLEMLKLWGMTTAPDLENILKSFSRWVHQLGDTITTWQLPNLLIDQISILIGHYFTGFCKTIYLASSCLDKHKNIAIFNFMYYELANSISPSAKFALRFDLMLHCLVIL